MKHKTVKLLTLIAFSIFLVVLSLWMASKIAPTVIEVHYPEKYETPCILEFDYENPVYVNENIYYYLQCKD